ncbi:MAG: RDD family protein [Pseudomonadota bacterium]
MTAGTATLDTLPEPDSEPQFYEGVRLRRLAAFLVDLIAILVLLGGVALIGIVVGLLTFGIGFAFIVPAFALTGIAYRTTLIAERSATLGMMLMGIELRDMFGRPLTLPLAFLHTCGFTAVSYLPPVLIASLIYAGLNRHGRTLHDALFQVTMINRPV